MKTQDLYESVTNSIVADLEQNNPTWAQPWKNLGTGNPLLPRNYATKRGYTGINVLILYMAGRDNLFARNDWMTFNQAKAAGGSVRKGEKGTAIVFTKPYTKNEGEEDEKTIQVMRTYVVFNVQQIDGIDFEEPEPPSERTDVETFVNATGVITRWGGDRAFYSPVADIIAMPHKSQFFEEPSFWATYLHELAHWTGHQSRLNRDLRNRFGTDGYAVEELVAEMAAAFLCAHLGIRGELRHPGYIKTWLGVLKNDKRCIFTAAAQATKAADYLSAFSERGVQSSAASYCVPNKLINTPTRDVSNLAR